MASYSVITARWSHHKTIPFLHIQSPQLSTRVTPGHAPNLCFTGKKYAQHPDSIWRCSRLSLPCRSKAGDAGDTARMYKELDQTLPNWQQVNRDESLLDWLERVQKSAQERRAILGLEPLTLGPMETRCWVISCAFLPSKALFTKSAAGRREGQAGNASAPRGDSEPKGTAKRTQSPISITNLDR